MTLEKQTEFISAALQEAYKCTPAKGAFCVGCVLVHNDRIISKSFSRELPGNTHAEANAIDKLQDDAILPHTDLYTTLEPCTTRTSGLHPCTATIITNNIKRVFIGASEPPDYVVCQGVDQLRNAGVDAESSATTVSLPPEEVSDCRAHKVPKSLC